MKPAQTYSPTYTFNSDFALPAQDTHTSTSSTRFSVVGYSKFFTSGLVSKVCVARCSAAWFVGRVLGVVLLTCFSLQSRKITRKLGWLKRRLQAVFAKLKPATT